MHGNPRTSLGARPLASQTSYDKSPKTCVSVNVRLFQLLLVLTIVPASALGAQEPEFFRPLDRASLTGVWEAVIPLQQQLVQMSIRDDGSSFLAVIQSTDGGKFTFTYPLKSCSIHSGSITLEFVSREGNAITVTGQGYATAIGGGDYIIATMRTGGAEKRGPGLDIVLRRGRWTRKLTELSNIAEDAIQTARTAKVIEEGNICNIPIYNQTTLAGDWNDVTPSAEETTRALRAVQLFLEEPKGTSDWENEAIDKIRAKTNHYKVQFIGIQREGKKRILCNFLPDRSASNSQEPFPNWKSEIVRTPSQKTGEFWRIEYDPKQDRCSDFHLD